MRRRNFFIAGIVALITFASLQAFVRPYFGNRLGWWGYRDRYYHHGGPGWGPRDYYDDRYHWRYDNEREPYNKPRNQEDSASRDRW